MPGGRIDILVEPDLKGFPAKLQSGLQSSTGIASKLGSGLGLALGGGLVAAGAGFKAIIDKTVEFQGNLNSLQAVTGATGDQMAAVSAKATQLGNDITLPGTSASTAAAAMLELAKGGLTVEQAMEAAKGTLTLAAAAQVDGAKAAQIQSDALNIFGLKATDASRVADILANSANASAVEITDVAESMKYVGPVAKGAGVSIEDTATAIALLGNNGIRGSEAGTSLRGMLAGLVAPSKASARALDELGVNAFDSQGKFVGFENVIDQLRVAQGKLTQEQFQGAVATAFGRETMSGVIALVNTAPGSFDKMREAVTRQGGAQEVAAAKMKGLGGAIEGFKGQLETTAIIVGGAMAPALDTIVRGATGVLGALTDAGTGVGGLADKFPGLNKLVESGGKLWDDFRTILTNVRVAVDPVVDAVKGLAESAGGEGGALQAVGAGLEFIGDAAVGASQLLGPIGDGLGFIVGVAGSLPGPLQAAALAFLAFKVVPSILSSLRGESEGAATSTSKLRAAVDGVTAPARGAAGALKQFHGEMKLQAALAEASGQSLSKLGAAQAAFETSTVGAVAAVRSFRDDVRALQAGAEGAGAPISKLEAAIGALAQRSSTVAAMAGSFDLVSTAVRSFGDTAGQAASTASTALGDRLASGAQRGVDALLKIPGAASGAASSLSTGLQQAVIRAGLELEALPGRVSAVGSSLSTGLQQAVIRTGLELGALSTKAVSAGQSLSTGLQQAVIRTGLELGALPAKVTSAASSLSTGLQQAVIRAGLELDALPTRAGNAVRSLSTSIGTGLQAIPGVVQSTFQKVGSAIDTGVSAVGRFTATVAGAGASLGTGLLKGAGSLVSFLGGPWGVALAAAGVALSILGQRQQEAAQKAQAHQAALDAVAGTLDRYSGAVTQATVNEKANQLAKDGTLAKVKELGIGVNDYTQATLGNAESLARVQTQLQTHTRGLIEQSTAYQTSGRELKAMGLNLDDLTQAALGNQPAIDRVNQSIARIADLDAQTQMRGLVDGMIAAGASSGELAKELGISNGELAKIQEQTRLAAEASGDFASKLDFLKQGLGGLKDGVAPTEAFRQALGGLATSARQAAQSAGEAAAKLNGVGAGGAAAAQSMQQSRDAFIAAATGAGLTADQAARLADQIGLIPAVAQTNFVTNATGVSAELNTLAAQVAAVPGAKQIVVNSTSPAVIAQLEALGAKVTTLPNGQVQIDVHDEAGRAKLDAFLTTIRTAAAAPKMDLDTATAQQKADAMKAHIDGLVGIAKADADAAPGTAKADALKSHIDGITALMKADADISPGTAKGNELQAHINGLVGTLTADANNAPGTAKGDALRSYINGLIAIMTADANSQPGTKKGADLKAYIDKLKAAITADVNDNAAKAKIAALTQARTMTITAIVQQRALPPGHTAAIGGIVKGMEHGGVLGMARGGMTGPKLTPMRGGIAQIVPPNSWRVIGDRVTDDEAFIPINRSRRSQRIFEETARRMGYQAVRMYAEGGLADTSAQIRSIAAQRVVTTSGPSNTAVVRELAQIRADLGRIQQPLVGNLDLSGRADTGTALDDLTFRLRHIRRGVHSGR